MRWGAKTYVEDEMDDWALARYHSGWVKRFAYFPRKIEKTWVFWEEYASFLTYRPVLPQFQDTHGRIELEKIEHRLIENAPFAAVFDGKFYHGPSV